MTVQLTGLGGFDSSNVITQLVALAGQPVTDLTNKKSLVDSASSTMTTFSSRLSTLKANATSMATTSGFISMAATSSDTGIVASVTGSSAAASYTISVEQLARAQKTRSDSQTSATAALGQTGAMTIQIGSGTPVSINIDATDSLSSIASKIAQSGTRISAGIINTGTGYRLQVQGLDSGAGNAITFGESGSVAIGLAKPTNVVESAQDAKLTVDGLPITRSTNQIADAVPGVTLALTKVITSPATLNVAADSSALKTKINNFVSAYNDVVQAGHSITGYGTTKAANSILAADSTIRRAVGKMGSLISSTVPGASGLFNSLTSVGVSLTKDGLMNFDSSKLDTALSKDPDSVARLFVTDSSTGATGVMKTMADSIDSMISGATSPIANRIASLTKQSTKISDTIDSTQKRVDTYEQQLRKQFSDLDIAMNKYSSMGSALSSLTTA